jgi:ribonuclease D
MAHDETVLIDRQDRLQDAVRSIEQAPVVGFDTEFVGDDTYETELCLLQVATADAIFLIDPLARIDLREFWLALTATGREVVAFAAWQELLFCRNYAGRLPESVFDPQLAAGLVGFGYPISYANLVRQLLGAHLRSSEAYTDWRQRPLTKKQLAYASDDVRHLLPAHSLLVERAVTMHRQDWLRSEFDTLVRRVNAWGQEEGWRRLPGATRLDRRKLAVLLELWRWREARARSANIPPRRVLRDDLLVETAKRNPRNLGDLFTPRGMDRPPLRRAGPDILAAIDRGLSVEEAELPLTGPAPRREDPPQLTALAQFLAVFTNSLAAGLEIAPSLLATSADLQDFVRWRLGLLDEEPPALREGWRGQVLGTALVELLEGKRFVSIANADSANPFRIGSFEG